MKYKLLLILAILFCIADAEDWKKRDYEIIIHPEYIRGQPDPQPPMKIEFPNDYYTHYFLRFEVTQPKYDSMLNFLSGSLRPYSIANKKESLSLDQDMRLQKFINRELKLRPLCPLSVDKYLNKYNMHIVLNDTNKLLKMLHAVTSLPCMYEPFLFENNHEIVDSVYHQIYKSTSSPNESNIQLLDYIRNDPDTIRLIKRMFQYQVFRLNNIDYYDDEQWAWLKSCERLASRTGNKRVQIELYNLLASYYKYMHLPFESYKYNMFSSKYTHYDGWSRIKCQDLLPLYNNVKILSEYENDSSFIDKILWDINWHGSMNYIFSPQCVNENGKFMPDYNFKILHGYYEYRKVQSYKALMSTKRGKYIELGIFYELYRHYLDAISNNVKLEPFIDYRIHKVIAEYISSNYTESHRALLYYEKAFDIALEDNTTNDFLTAFSDYYHELLKNGMYDIAQRYKEVTETLYPYIDNEHAHAAVTYYNVETQLQRGNIDSANLILNSFKQNVNDSIYRNDLQVQNYYYHAKKAIAESDNNKNNLFESDLNLKGVSYMTAIKLQEFKMQEEKFKMEDKFFELGKIYDSVEAVQWRLYHMKKLLEAKIQQINKLNDTITTRKKEVEEQNKSIGVLNSKIETKNIELETSTKKTVRLKIVSDSLTADIKLKEADIKKMQYKLNYGALLVLILITTILLYYNSKLKNKNRVLEKANKTIKTETEARIEATNKAANLTVSSERLEKELAIASNDFLKDRLNIHHAKGGLKTISYVIGRFSTKLNRNNNIESNLKNEINVIYDKVKELKEYAKQCIENSDNPVIELSKEIENSELFINLYNFGKYSNTIELKVSDKVKEKGNRIKFPSNMLQPLIQNSAEHAFLNYQNPNGNQISIDILDNDLIIYDNGIGNRRINNIQDNIDDNDDCTGISLTAIRRYLDALNKQDAQNNYTFTITYHENGTIVKFLNLVA